MICRWLKPPTFTNKHLMWILKMLKKLHMHDSPHKVHNLCLNHAHILASLWRFPLLSLDWNFQQLVPQAHVATKGAYASCPLQQFLAIFSIQCSRFKETNSPLPISATWSSLVLIPIWSEIGGKLLLPKKWWFSWRFVMENGSYDK